MPPSSPTSVSATEHRRPRSCEDASHASEDGTASRIPRHCSRAGVVAHLVITDALFVGLALRSPDRSSEHLDAVADVYAEHTL